MSTLMTKKGIGALVAALGSIIVFIASFLTFYKFEIEGKSKNMDLKEVSDYAKDAELTSFNPHALFIIFAVIGIIAVFGILYFPRFDKICSAVACAAGIAALVTVIIYATSGTLGDLKDYIDKTIKQIKLVAEAFGEDVDLDNTSTYGPGYILTIIGSILMILGSGFAFAADFIFPKNEQ